MLIVDWVHMAHMHGPADLWPFTDHQSSIKHYTAAAGSGTHYTQHNYTGTYIIMHACGMHGAPMNSEHI